MVHERLACLLLLNLLFPINIIGTKVPAIIVFGDSTVDGGNNNHIPTLGKCNFAPYGRDFKGGKPTGRFCNGRIFTDFLSEKFGIKWSIPAYLDPDFGIEDFATGVTFGSGGSGYDNATSDLLSVIPLWKQLEYYKEYQQKLISFLGKDKATEILREALYIISMGTCDFFVNYFNFPTRRSQFTVDEYKDFIIQIAGKFIHELYGLGARKISMVGLANTGCVPLGRSEMIIFGKVCKEYYNKVSRDFNVKLKSLIADLRQELGGIQLVYSDLYNFLSQLLQHSYLYGFENSSEACCGTGPSGLSLLCYKENICTDANKYVFFDFVHPTEKAYGIYADYLMKTSLAEFV